MWKRIREKNTREIRYVYKMKLLRDQTRKFVKKMRGFVCDSKKTIPIQKVAAANNKNKMQHSVHTLMLISLWGAENGRQPRFSNQMNRTKTAKHLSLLFLANQILWFYYSSRLLWSKKNYVFMKKREVIGSKMCIQIAKKSRTFDLESRIVWIHSIFSFQIDQCQLLPTFLLNIFYWYTMSS